MKRPFKKWRVLKYEPASLFAVTYERIVFKLTAEVHTWWGLIKRIETETHELDPTSHDFQKTLEKWEEQKTWSNELKRPD